jgi:hypothetical protein
MILFGKNDIEKVAANAVIRIAGSDTLVVFREPKRQTSVVLDFERPADSGCRGHQSNMEGSRPCTGSHPWPFLEAALGGFPVV